MTARDLAEGPDTGPRSGRALPAAAEAAATTYRSLFVIGRGGMGSVEAALTSAEGAIDRDRVYERVVALKRLLPDGARDARRVEMFLREARLAAMLEHPNVVRAYDYGELDGELYLAMEYVEGQPLSRVLQALDDAGERMPPSVVAWVLAETCRGLHAAHELADPSTGAPLHLVHRDVSPQNVMIGYDGRVRLLDFGVAKIEAENVTRTGEVKGKTAYMSPEQAMGDPLDRRSDLFGVGALLFECLALRRMWGAGTDMDVLRKLALEAPPSLEACGEPLPAGLAELHARLVAREAKDRPATALEVADALARFTEDPPAAARELRAILEAHFGEQARAQRARLEASLRAIAPRQADALRESLAPTRASDAPPVARDAPRASDAPPVARDASTTARDAVAPASAASTTGRRATTIAVVLAAAVGALLVWRATRPATEHGADDTARAPVAASASAGGTAEGAASVSARTATTPSATSASAETTTAADAPRATSPGVENATESTSAETATAPSASAQTATAPQAASATNASAETTTAADAPRATSPSPSGSASAPRTKSATALTSSATTAPPSAAGRPSAIAPPPAAAPSSRRPAPPDLDEKPF